VAAFPVPVLNSAARKLVDFFKAAEGLSGTEVDDFCIENGVGVIRDATYDPSHGKTKEQMVEWHLFMLFLVRHLHWRPEAASSHVEWLLQHLFTAVAEWLADDRWRASQGMRSLSAEHKARWIVFASENRHRSLNDITSELELASDEARAA
jgi:hypothetical protein